MVATLSPSLPANAGFLNKDKLPEVIKPVDAEIDQDILKSSDVQDELKAIRKYQAGVSSIKADFTGNPQADLYDRVRKVRLEGLRSITKYFNWEARHPLLLLPLV